MKRILLLLAFVFVISSVNAQKQEAELSPIVDSSHIHRTTRVPFKNGKRIDREINKNQFAFKGEVMLGLTASYGTLTSNDTHLGLILDNIDVGGSIVSVKPYVGYLYRDDQCIGLRLGYSSIDGRLGNARLNLGEANDVQLSVGNMKYKNNSFMFGIFHRTYVPLDAKGRFGVFAEFELMASIGKMEFAYKTDDVWHRSLSDIYKAKFSFSPGIAAYIFPNVCATLSFGMGGLQYTHTKQYDGDHNLTGKRDFSKMRFRLNIADINIGVTIHLWNKKKDGPVRRFESAKTKR